MHFPRRLPALGLPLAAVVRSSLTFSGARSVDQILSATWNRIYLIFKGSYFAAADGVRSPAASETAHSPQVLKTAPSTSSAAAAAAAAMAASASVPATSSDSTAGASLDTEDSSAVLLNRRKGIDEGAGSAASRCFAQLLLTGARMRMRRGSSRELAKAQEAFLHSVERRQAHLLTVSTLPPLVFRLCIASGIDSIGSCDDGVQIRR